MMLGRLSTFRKIRSNWRIIILEIRDKMGINGIVSLFDLFFFVFFIRFWFYVEIEEYYLIR